MTVRNAQLFKILIFLPLVTLVGCQSPFSASNPPIVKPEPTGMNLVGKWDFYMRSESNVSNIVHGAFAITEENCSEQSDVCELRGYLELVINSSKQSLPITGFSYPKAPLVRFSYNTGTLVGEPVLVIVEFDSFPKQLVPGRAMVGYAVKFIQGSPGMEYTDSPVLQAAGRGMAFEVGRASAWPLPNQ